VTKVLLRRLTGAVAALLLSASAACAQQTVPSPAAGASTEQQAPAPKGTVLFERHADPDATTPDSATPKTAVQDSAKALPVASGPELSDDERAAITVTSYDLDAQLKPATNGLQMRARMTLRNDGSAALTRVALQVSSTLTWESVSLLPADGRAAQRLPLTQHLIETDADHTGKASEAIVTLEEPLAPGASVALDTFYSGTIAASGARLEAIGATPDAARSEDWDAIAPMPNGLLTALRGMGSVLWYPVAAPQLFLGDGAKLFQYLDATRMREASAMVHLRLAVEYSGEPPAAVYFCARRRELKAISDDADSPGAAGHGLATAEFPAEPLGFRLPSLFVVSHEEMMIAYSPTIRDVPAQSSSSSATEPSPVVDEAATKPESAAAGDEKVPMVALETDDTGVSLRLSDSAESVAPLLQQWFGPRPLSALTVLDHDGQPFEDGPLLVAQAAGLAGSTSMGALAHSMAHAWVQTGVPWMDEGLPQFAELLEVEQQQGREAAIAQLQELSRPLDLAEIVVDPAKVADEGQPLVAASDELYYRRKSAAVWWMLRDITGDDALRAALIAWCGQPVSQLSPREQALAFEHLLEKASGKDLSWFFADWVLRDRGLPDLSLVGVEPHLLPAGETHASGWLVSVTVHNDGGAAADVPLIIRSGTFSTTRRMHIAGFASSTERVLVETSPSEVVVNDGSTPEVRSSTHKQEIAPPAK
jgi:hypothetical protein